MSWAPRSIHGKHLLLVAVAFAGAIPYGWHAALSLVAGGGVQVINLGALERSVRRMLGRAQSHRSPAAQRQRGRVGVFGGQLLASARFVLLLAAVAALLVWAPVHPLGLLVGLSLVVPAAIWHGLAESHGHVARGR